MASLCINETWTNRQVCELLEKAGLDKTKFEGKEGIDGKKALKLTDDDLKKMGITDAKERLGYLNVIRNNQHKVINDPVHGIIKLHPLLIRIIDTPQFQRLRNIKQLGGASFVYPGACHTRFEHSIGVAHLAGELAEALKQSTTTMDDTDKDKDTDVLCVQIAGLCHDLGCGPFSYAFKDIIREQRDGSVGSAAACSTHREISVKMFDYLVEENGLKPLMKLYGLKDNDLTFIKEMMNPKEKYEGRTHDKYFLYEIVFNSMNSIDVDQFDYFARDCYYLGLQNSFDHQRFLKFARVCEAEDKKTHICMKDKDVDNVFDIFQTRYRLHKRAYQHRVVKAVELMMKDAFLEAKDLIIAGSDKKLDVATKDMAALTKLTDHVFEQIHHYVHPDLQKATEILQKIFFPNIYSSLGELDLVLKEDFASSSSCLKKAKEILERIISRDLYDCLGETEAKVSEEDIEKLRKSLEDINQPEEDFAIVDITAHNGNKEDLNKNIYFYIRGSTNSKATTNPKLSEILPDYFFETVIRVYYKKTDQTRKQFITKAFRKWCQDKKFQLQDRDQLKMDENIDLK